VRVPPSFEGTLRAVPDTAQGGKAPQHLLDPLEVSNWAHSLEGSNLFGVGLDASLGDNVS
jgi:hypothetical protein